MSVSTQASTMLSIRGKRRTMGVDRMKERYMRTGAAEGRALVRVGRGTTEILIGKEDLSTWDMEELRRGRKRDKNGGWQGRDPVIVAKAVHDELVKRTLDEAQRIMRDNLESAVTMLTELATNPGVEPKDRLKAIDMIMNRVMGRDPQKVEIESDSKFEAAIAHSIVSLPDELVDKHVDNRDEGLDDDDV